MPKLIYNIGRKMKTDLKLDNIKFLDVRNKPFDIYGLYNPKSEKVFRRLPADVAEKVSDSAKVLSTHTAGGRVRFCTDSSYIAIKANVKGLYRMPHFPLTGSSGFDLYIDNPDIMDSRYYKCFMMDPKVKDEYELVINFGEKKLRYFTINFPTYCPVQNLYVGIENDAGVGSGLKYNNIAPIVYYGPSILQGGCCSHPGNAYPAIISRKLNIDYYNFGFSGAAKGEDAIIDYLSSLDMSIFVSDFDHNLPNDSVRLKERHMKLYKAIREKHPDIPYIMASRTDDISVSRSGIVNNRIAIFENYMEALKMGDQNVYFLDGQQIFNGVDREQCTVDGTHPNDLGFKYMADAFYEAIRQMLLKKYL